MNIVVAIDKTDSSYMYKLRELLSGHNLTTVIQHNSLVTPIKKVCKNNKTDKVICTSLDVLKKLVARHNPLISPDAVSLHDYRGSTFYDDGLQYLFLPHMNILNFIPEAEFLFKRWLQKITNPNFPTFPELNWKILTPENIDVCLEKAKSAIAMGVDIETRKIPMNPEVLSDPLANGMWTMVKKSKTGKKLIPACPAISMIGYACLYQNKDGSCYSETYVLQIKTVLDIMYMRQFNLLPAFKIFQNGGYDHSYLLRYNAPCTNYLGDTFVAMHAWLVELPRTLAFIGSLFNKNHIYWKDDGEFNMPHYNAQDCHNTLWAFMIMWKQMPQWARDNYYENFRYQFPCITVGLEGFLCDEVEKERLLEVEEGKEELAHKKLQTIVGEGFNPASPKQTLTVLHGLGFKKAKNSDKATMQDFCDTHPFYDEIGSRVKEIRGYRKAISNYFTVVLLNGRIMYEQNPAATDTSRFNSKDSNFWCGQQIQNVPLYAKSMYVADKGYVLGAADGSQAESRCTAYISEDRKLINTVEDSKDFHKVNASLFFGVPYDEITKAIRTTAKRTNHGANYNMGWLVLMQTMGRKAVMEAARLLRLPRTMSIKQICEYLLKCFDKAYPDVRGKYYDEVVKEIQMTGLLVGATGWTRKCFADPTTKKHYLNKYVAHGPQSLNVKILNPAFFESWLHLQILEPVVDNRIRMKAQVHDEIIWQCKPHMMEASTAFVKKEMERPIIVRGRTLIIPTDPTTNCQNWAEIKE